MKQFINFVYSIFQWGRKSTANMINNDRIGELYFIYGFAYAAVSIFLGIKLHLIFRIMLLVIFMAFLAYIHFYIRLKVRFEDKYRDSTDVSEKEQRIFGLADKYKYMARWRIALLYYLIISTILLKEYSNIISWMILLVFFSIAYFYLKSIVFKKVNHWLKFSLLFLSSPIIAALFLSFCGMHLMDLTKNYFFISKDSLGWATLILSIIIMNLIIYTAPDERISELKVAIYFCLAIFSTISYCFFLSDIFTDFIMKVLKFSLDKELIKQTADTIIKWFSLPYLIGMVFGCFTIELKQRNMEL